MTEALVLEELVGICSHGNDPSGKSSGPELLFDLGSGLEPIHYWHVAIHEYNPIIRVATGVPTIARTERDVFLPGYDLVQGFQTVQSPVRFYLKLQIENRLESHQVEGVIIHY